MNNSFPCHTQFTKIYLYIALIFGVFLYDFIGDQLSFTFIDEILVLWIFLFAIMHKGINRECRTFILIALFYLVYSFIISSNVYQGILMDFTIQVKPFIAFYCAYKLNLGLTIKQRKGIKKLVLLLVIIVLIIACVDYDFAMYRLLGHTSRFATFYEVLGFTYFYCSDRNKKDLFITICIWCIGLLSMRSKCYGFVSISIALLYAVKDKHFYKFKLSSICIVIMLIAVMMFAAWDKIYFYLYTGTLQADDISDMFARPALYATSFKILLDYIPFGSGFGSFACFASREYYSPLYAKYGIDTVFGLSKEVPEFISDTYYPVLSQFGIIGIILIFIFFKRRVRTIINSFERNGNSDWLKISILFIVFFLIESLSDSTMIQNRGVVIMIIFAMYINEGKHISKE